MKSKMLPTLAALLLMAGLTTVRLVTANLRPVHAGQGPSSSAFKVLEPIRHGNLTVFPVVAPKSYATNEFLTLDEGLRSGEVVVTEYGNVRGLFCLSRSPAPPPHPRCSAILPR
jgi:hypothetical protein